MEEGLAVVAPVEEPTAPDGQPLASPSSEARDPDRFNCPFPGCSRSFAELWRLKVHYRAPPDVRGSGKERGHGTELEFCPKCTKQLKPGKHHVGCSASKRQSKRPRQQAEQDTSEGSRLHRSSTGSLRPEELHDAWVAAGGMAFPAGAKLPPLQHHVPGLPGAFYYAPAPNGMQPMPVWGPPGALQPAFAMLPHPAVGMQMHPPHYAQQQLVAFHPGMPHGAVPFQHVLMAAPPPQQQQQPVPMVGQPPPAAPEQTRDVQLAGMFDDEEAEVARMPSPPPLPPDFAGGSQPQQSMGGSSQLFNFGQFSHRMPSTQPLLTGNNKLVKDLTQEALDLAKANVVYETHDDGDLMELLFGVADEMPTMATFHLHKFSSQGQHHQQHSPPATPGSGMEQHQQHQQHQQHFGSTERYPQHEQHRQSLGVQQQGMGTDNHCQQEQQQQQQQQQQQRHHHASDVPASFHSIKQETQPASQGVGATFTQGPMQQTDGFTHVPMHGYQGAGSTESVLTKESILNNAGRWRETHSLDGSLPSGLFDCG